MVHNRVEGIQRIYIAVPTSQGLRYGLMIEQEVFNFLYLFIYIFCLMNWLNSQMYKCSFFSQSFQLTYILNMQLSAISETNFHYQDKSSPIGYVVYVASNMQVHSQLYSCIWCQFIFMDVFGVLTDSFYLVFFFMQLIFYEKTECQNQKQLQKYRFFTIPSHIQLLK